MLDMSTHGGFEEVRKKLRSQSALNRSLRAKADDRIGLLEEEVMFLNLVNRVLIKALTERGVMTEDELLALFHELDAQDGRKDGGSSGDALAKDLGFDELPAEREPAPPKVPVKKKRGR